MPRDVVIILLVCAAALAVHFLPKRFRLMAWVAAILAVVPPWQSFQNHSHWPRVAWVPFFSGPIQFGDIFGNVLLYVPFGYWLGERWKGRHGWYWRVVACAAVLSLVTEASQSYSHGRFPSATDVVLNITGCALGAWGLSRRR